MKKGERKRGFNQFNKDVRDKPSMAKAIANCESCQYLDADGECTNLTVSEYDMVRDGTKTYCSFWRGFEFNNGRKKKITDW